MFGVLFILVSSKPVGMDKDEDEFLVRTLFMNLTPNCNVELFDLMLKRLMSFLAVGKVLKLSDEFEEESGDEDDDDEDVVDGVITCGSVNNKSRNFVQDELGSIFFMEFVISFVSNAICFELVFKAESND